MATKATHKAAGPTAPDRPSLQIARQAGVEAGAACAAHLMRVLDTDAEIVVGSLQTLSDLETAQEVLEAGPDTPEAARPPKQARTPQTQQRGRKRPRAEQPPAPKATRYAGQHEHATRNIKLLLRLAQRTENQKLSVNAPCAATGLDLISLARRAARTNPTHTHVYPASGPHRTGPMWAGNRIWDPGD